MIRLRNAVGLLLLTLFVSAAPAREPGFAEFQVVQESLSRVHPRMRARWLRERGLDDSYYTTFRKPESSGLREVGRWPWGPSWELAGRDTFLYLGSGSGVRILSIADSVQPRMLGQIVARGLVSQVVVQDTLLFVACGGWGAQIYSVVDPANPRELGSMDAAIGDLCVKDTFCYTVGGDSLRIYNVSNPAQPEQVGTAADSGDVVLVANGHAFVGGPGTLNLYDVSDPAHPTRAASLPGPTYDVFVRRNLLFRTTGASPTRFSILNIADPLKITEVSGLNGYAGTEGIHANDSFAFVSCIRDHVGLFVFDVSDSSRPVVCDSIAPEGNVQWEPYAPQPRSYCYLADDYGGLEVIDAHDANNLSEVCSGYKAASSVDICIDNNRAYIANSQSGLQVVDVTDPTAATSLGIFDIFGAKVTSTATARDSFAYIGMSGIARREYLRVLDVLDPSNPTVVAQESCFNPPQDIVLRDSFVYAAEHAQFQVFSVARPREPVRVGSCALNGYSGDLALVDTFAYLSGPQLTIVNVARPDSPRVVRTWARGVSGLDVVDTILYAVGQNAQFWTVSVADPAALRPLDSVHLPSYDGEDVVVIGSTAYASERAIRMIDVSNPADLRLVGQASVPSWTPRLYHAAPYLYACCAEGGICILETVPSGIAEIDGTRRLRGLTILPSVTNGRLIVEVPWPHSTADLMVFDITGKEVLRLTMPAQQGEAYGRWPVDVSRLPAGVYVLRLEENGVTGIGKAVINRR